MKPPEPPEEQARLAALEDYGILDTDPEAAFNDLAHLAATLFSTPIAIVSFIDEDRQWSKACIGLDLDQVGREISFCAHAILEPEEVFVVEDTLEDERFRGNPLVQGEQGIRFYAGAPLVSPEGYALGTICVLDREPRKPTSSQLEGLSMLAGQAVAQLEEHRRTRKLAERDAILEQLSRALPQVLWIVSPDLSELRFMSPHAETFWGVPEEELRANPLAFLDRVPSEERQQLEATIANELGRLTDDPGHEPRIEFRLEDPRVDRERWIEVQASGVSGPEGQLLAVCGIAEDVSERKRADERRRRLAREEARMAELKQLLFSTSHSLRTRVRQIRSFAQLLDQRVRDRLDDEAHEHLDFLITGTRELEALHRALKRYAEATMGGRAFEPVDLDAVLDGVLDELDPALTEAEASIDRDELGTVEGDRDQLEALLTELVENVVRFRSEAPLEIRIRAAREGEHLQVAVEDNGRGFDPKHAERIFGTFQQLDPDEGDEAVGIGLTIARRIVENHGGEIEADATPGEGATFTFTLPVRGEDR